MNDKVVGTQMTRTVRVVLAALLLAALGLLAVSSVEAHPPLQEPAGPWRNLIYNSRFEEGLAGWNTSSGSAIYTADDLDPHSGLYSAKGIEDASGSLGRLYQDVTGRTQPGKAYKISGWIKTEGVVGSVVIGLNYVNDGGWTPEDGFVQEIGHVSGTSDWTYYESRPFRLPEMPDDTSSLWFLFDFNGAYGTAYWDDVRLLGPPALHVQAIAMTYQERSEQYVIVTFVRIIDAAGRPVREATVSVDTQLLGGDVVSQTATTNRLGLARYFVVSPQVGTYTSTVTDVSKVGWVHDMAADEETSERLDVW